MSQLLGLFLFCFVNAVSFCQQTIDVPIVIVSDDDQDAMSLKPTDLKIEVGGQPTVVASIVPLAGRHLHYVLVNDASSINAWPRSVKQADAAAEFLKEIVVANSDIGTLVNFSDQAFLDLQNEKDPQKLAAKLVRNGRGGTALHDAVVSAANWLAQEPDDPDFRKVMFLFCDGQDNASRLSLNQVDKALPRTGIPIFIIAPSTVEAKKDGQKLRHLADLSGGRVYFLSGKTGQMNFEMVKRDLARSFLMRIPMLPSQGHEFSTLTITPANNLRIRVAGPSEIAQAP